MIDSINNEGGSAPNEFDPRKIEYNSYGVPVLSGREIEAVASELLQKGKAVLILFFSSQVPLSSAFVILVDCDLELHVSCSPASNCAYWDVDPFAIDKTDCVRYR